MSLIGWQFWMVLAVALLLAIDSSVLEANSLPSGRKLALGTFDAHPHTTVFHFPLEELNRPVDPSVLAQN
jgi:hypothetical protein